MELLTGSVGRACDPSSSSQEFEPHTGPTSGLNKQTNKTPSDSGISMKEQLAGPVGSQENMSYPVLREQIPPACPPRALGWPPAKDLQTSPTPTCWIPWPTPSKDGIQVCFILVTGEVFFFFKNHSHIQNTLQVCFFSFLTWLTALLAQTVISILDPKIQKQE